MANSTFTESYRSHGFVLEIDGRRLNVTKVSGLSEGTADVIEQPDGGSARVHKIAAPFVKFDPLVIERNMDGSDEDKFFKDWFSETFQLNGRSGTSSTRHHGAVIKMENGREVLRFAFYGAWVKSSKFSDMEAGSTSLFKQTVEIEHDGLERVG